MALALTTGGGTISIVQQSAAFGYAGSATLPAASTPGNCLILVVAKFQGSFLGPFAPWTTLFNQTQGTNCTVAVYAYPNNPGGIQAVTFAPASTYVVHLSEWANVDTVATLDVAASGATSTSGTTLALASGALATSGDLAIACWAQQLAVAGTVTFTTPTGYIRLLDDGATSSIGHLDIETKINPALAGTSPTMTSSGTTAFSAGLIVVLKPVPAAVTQTSYLKYGSMTLKLNTFDFALQDPATVPQLGQAVTLTTPTWSGRVVDLTLADVVDRATGHKLATVTATNASTAPGGVKPGDLSDTPNGTTTFGYSGLSVKSTQNQDGVKTTYGRVTTYTAGFLAGMTFALTSANLGYSATTFTISNVTTIWQGLQQPAYLIEFGDVYPTLQAAGGGVLVNQAGTAAVGVARLGAMGAGTLGSATITAAVNGLGNNVDITGLTTTVQVASSRRLRVHGQCPLTKHTNGNLALNLLQDGAQIAQWIVVATDGTTYSANVVAVVVPGNGTHVYKLQVGNSAGTADAAASATAMGFILVEDVGA